MIKKIFLTLLITSFSILSAEVLSKSIGMSAGYISGSGFSYRVMNGKIGYQIAGGLYYNKHKEELNYSHEKYDNIYCGSNISASIYYNLINKKTSYFYLLSGATLFRVDRKYDNSTSKVAKSINYYLNIGVGIGLEFPLTKHFHASIDWPWYYDNKTNFLKFIPQTGVHYYF